MKHAVSGDRGRGPDPTVGDVATCARLGQATAWTGTDLLGWGGASATSALDTLDGGIHYQLPTRGRRRGP